MKRGMVVSVCLILFVINNNSAVNLKYILAPHTSIFSDNLLNILRKGVLHSTCAVLNGDRVIRYTEQHGQHVSWLKQCAKHGCGSQTAGQALQEHRTQDHELQASLEYWIMLWRRHNSTQDILHTNTEQPDGHKVTYLSSFQNAKEVSISSF